MLKHHEFTVTIKLDVFSEEKPTPKQIKDTASFEIEVPYVSMEYEISKIVEKK